MDDFGLQSLRHLLTARELEILQLVVAGMSNREIADELVLTLETVRWYTKQIYSKLGVHSRAEALTQARESGWFDAPSQEASAAQPAHNLPGQLTSLVGREHEITAIKALLDSSRLVTLTGPGGIGKTRLALQLAAEMIGDFADGVYFVALAPISDHTLVANTIAGVLDVIETAGKSLVESLKSFLRDRRMLLVLDNYEHVIEAASLASELLAAAPRLKIIVTSREVLRLYGEHEYSVPPLSVPNLKVPLPIAQLIQYEAVALFIQRAQVARLDFKVNDDNAPVVAEICARLDGLPLAIELAAARAKLFAPQALLDRLAKHATSLQSLTGGSRDAPARQQTLRNTIAWSYDLLDESEKLLFMRLAVFSGGCSLEAAEAVCGEMYGTRNTAPLLDGLESLFNKNLVRQTEGRTGEPRFWMLETIREYALERLLDSGEEHTLRRAHLHFFLALAEQAESQFYGSYMQTAWFDRVEAERDNLRAAMEWSVTRGEAETGLRLASALGGFWDLGDYWREAVEWLEKTLAAASNPSVALRAKALRWAGELGAFFDNGEPSRAVLEEALSLARQAEDKLTVAWCMRTLALQAQIQFELSRSCLLYEEALILFRDTQDKWGLSHSLRGMGMTLVGLGDYQQAAAFLEEAETLARDMGDANALGQVYYSLGYMSWLQDGNPARTIGLYQQSLVLLREARNRLIIDFVLIGLGEIARSQKDDGRAIQYYREGIALAQEMGYIGGILTCLEGLGALAGMRRRLEVGAKLFGAAERLRETFTPMMDWFIIIGVEDDIAAVRTQLEVAIFEGAWAEGGAMTLDQAVAYALEQ